MLDARENSSNIENAAAMVKILKIYFNGKVFFSTDYNRTRDGKKWDAFIKGIGWEKYSRAVEIEASIPDDEIDLAVAVRRFGEDAAASLIEQRFSYYDARELVKSADFLWNSTYEIGKPFPVNDFMKFIRYDRRLALMGFPCLDIAKTDDDLKRAFGSEYPETMSMGDFIAMKFGEETRKAYAILIGIDS